MDIKLKNKDLLKQKIKAFSGLLLRLVIAYVIIIFIKEFFIDGIFNDYIATATFDSDASFYYWCVTHKGEILFTIIGITFCIIIYTYISKRENDMNKLYNSLENILNDDATKKLNYQILYGNMQIN